MIWHVYNAILSVTILEKVIIKCVPCCRNHEIPHNAAHAGTTREGVRCTGKQYTWESQPC